MWQLKERGTLTYNVVSMYAFQNLKFNYNGADIIPLIKFGGWDQEAMINGSKLHVF